MPITATGIGSGLDVESLVSQLVSADITPAATRLSIKEARFQAEISAFGTLKSAVAAFQGSISSVNSVATYQSKAASTTLSDKIQVSASSSASNGEYNVTVSALAEAQSLVANATFSDLSDTVGSGTLTLSSGGSDTSIVIDPTNNTLAGVAQAINESGGPATAAVIYDGTYYRLTLVANSSGTSNAITVTVDDADGADADSSNLSRLATANLTETNAAVDAALKINGLDITSATNSVSTAIDGVTLTLKAVTDAGELAKISVSDNTNAITSAVSGFVDGYNELVTTLEGLSAYDSDTQVASALTGDSTLRSILRSIRSTMNEEIVNVVSRSNSLVDLGITTDSNGKLQQDADALNAAIASNPMDVATVFADVGRSANTDFRFANSTDATMEGTYRLVGSDTSTPASLSGSAAITTFKFTGGDPPANFNIAVDGGSARAISLTGNYGSLANLLTEINTQLNAAPALGLTATESSGVLVFTSSSTGSASSVTISGADAGAIATLKLADGTGSGSSDFSYTLGGNSVTLDAEDGTYTGSTSTPVSGLEFSLRINGSGDLGDVVFTRGIASQLDDLLTSILDSAGLIKSKIDGLEESIDDIEAQRERLDLRAVVLEDRYRLQFNSLETLISQLNGTQGFLNSALSGFVDPNTTLRK